MNRRYYARIYLNPRPSPFDMSLLDNDEALDDNPTGYNCKNLFQKFFQSDTLRAHFPANSADTITDKISIGNDLLSKNTWLRITCEIKAPGCLWQSYLNADLRTGDSIKHYKVRLFNAISSDSVFNSYGCYIHVPEYFQRGTIQLYISSPFNFEGTVRWIYISRLDK